MTKRLFNLQEYELKMLMDDITKIKSVFFSDEMHS